jgi:hypothetical protein
MNKHPQLLDLLDGYYKCRECGKIAPIHTMSKHHNICDWSDKEDIDVYDAEVQKMYDLHELRDYYMQEKKRLNSEHIKRNQVHIMSQFPDLMVRRLEERIKEQKVVCWTLDRQLHTHPNQMEVEEIKTIRDLIPMKIVDDLSVVY